MRKKKLIYVGTITPEQIYRMHRGRFLPTSGFGIHGDVKYNRNKQKRLNKKYIQEGFRYY